MSFREWCAAQADCDMAAARRHVGGHMSSRVGGRRRAAPDTEGGGADETWEEEEASSLAASALVNFQILGNEEAANVSSSGELMALLSRMGAEGYLWPLGVRALKTPATPWLIVGRDCARGDRYNDPPCTGRGRCVSGVCVCEDKYSGERCETRAAFDSRVLASLASWVRLVAAAILALGVVCHLLSWVISGGLRLTNQPVAGDYWSLVFSPPHRLQPLPVNLAVSALPGCRPNHHDASTPCPNRCH